MHTSAPRLRRTRRLYMWHRRLRRLAVSQRRQHSLNRHFRVKYMQFEFCSDEVDGAGMDDFEHALELVQVRPRGPPSTCRIPLQLNSDCSCNGVMLFGICPLGYLAPLGSNCSCSSHLATWPLLTFLARLAHLPTKGFPKTPESVHAKTGFQHVLLQRAFSSKTCSPCFQLAKFRKSRVLRFRISRGRCESARFPMKMSPREVHVENWEDSRSEVRRGQLHADNDSKDAAVACHLRFQGD